MFAFFSIKEMCYVLTEQSEEIGQEDLDWIWPPKIPFFWAIINLFVLKPFFIEKNYFSLSQEKSTLSPQIYWPVSELSPRAYRQNPSKWTQSQEP